MFITTLTKKDWFRIFKYLWKTNCLSRPRRYFILFCFTILTINEAIMLFFIIFEDVRDLAFILVMLADFILLINWHPYYFNKYVKKFSPQTVAVFEKNPTSKMIWQVKQKYPGIKVYKYGIFSPPYGNKWTILVFKDYYLLHTTFYTSINNRNRKKHVVIPIKRSDINDTTEFLERLDPICQRKIDLSDVKLSNS